MQYGEEGSPAALHEVGKLLEESPLYYFLLSGIGSP